MLLFEISLVVLLQRLFKVGAVLVGVGAALAGVAGAVVQSCVEVLLLVAVLLLPADVLEHLEVFCNASNSSCHFLNSSSV